MGKKIRNDSIVENPDLMRDVHTMVVGETTDGPTETSMPHGLDPRLLQLMRDANAVLRTRYERLQGEYDEAEIVRMTTHV